ncbi:MAG: single-stranded DNA-binding protein [Deltaproteobacteria bacterium]|nr:single-stranded DNA-binding protein [Deltaproteobacteria bacterium]MCB9788781.1 single-stranded DNA-binding protein [Deltaproteobacteria bacterium]
MSVNTVFLVGNLGADPELRQTRTGKAVCTLSVATQRWRVDAEGEEVEWHRVVVWEKAAENCHRFLKKGRLVAVEGRLSTRSWDDAEGRKRLTTEIVASRVTFLPGGKGTEEGATPGAGQGARVPFAPAIAEEALPF